MVMKPIKFIRKHIFKLTQAEFGLMLGIKQSVVSDMEKSGIVTMGHQITIREEAARRGMQWSDSWFFEMPEDFEEAA